MHEECTLNEQCHGYPFYHCIDQTCMHKPVFPPQVKEIIGFVLLAVLMGLCNVAGIGGGAIDVPLVMLFFHFSIKEAIALSNMIIFMGTVARYLYKWNEMNPDKPRVVLVDYSMAAVMMPITLAGSQVGVMLILTTFPPVLIQGLLEFLLIFLTCNSLLKGWRMRKEENRLRHGPEVKENLLEGS